MIYFENIRWKNFLSTGNQWTDIPLNEHANTIIVGENGAGKSTILDALCFVLFNKPFRKISKSQMLNSINMGGLEVEVKFRIGKMNYKIRRGMKPNVFEIYQDSTLLNQPGSQRDYQKQLEETILKLNFKSFTQIVVLGASTFIPFMQLSVSHRREVIEDLLDISIFSNMGRLLKDRVAENKESIRDADYQIDLLKTKIDTQQSYIRKLKEQNDDTIATFQNLIDGAQDEINDLTQLSNGIVEKIEFLSEDVAPLKVNENKKAKLIDIHNRMRRKIKNAEKRIAFFNDNAECPTCSQDINDDIRESKISETNATISEVQAGEGELQKKLAELDSKINELAGTTTRKLKKVRSEGSYQFHGNTPKPKVPETKKQKWILVNKQGKLSGILDHIAFDTRESAKAWFQNTSDISGGTIRIDDHYYVLKNEEYEFLKELDVLDLIADHDIN